MWSNKRWVECMLNLKEKNELGFPQCRRVKWLSLKSPAVNASKLWPRGGWTLASVLYSKHNEATKCIAVAYHQGSQTTE